MLTFVGCSDKTNSTEAGMNSKETVSAPQPANPSTSVEQPKATTGEKSTSTEKNQQVVKVYYPDKQANHLVEKTQEIKWSTSESKYEAAFKALFYSDDSTLVNVWKEQPVTIKLENGLLTVNLDKPIQAGSTVERFMIQSLLHTMFQFSEIQQVQILISGKTVETLSGHIGINQPFTRKSLADL